MEQYTNNLKKLNRHRAGYKSKITRIQRFLVEKAETSDDVELRSRLSGVEELVLNIENLKLEYYALLEDDDLDEHQLQFDAIEEQLEDSRIDDDLTARINMADAKFSFQEKGKMYDPAWMSPEALQKKQDETNVRASDMWSYAMILWELATCEVPFAELSPMQTGMKIALEGLRVTVPLGISQHMSRLIRICMNEDPGKRPSFEMILPILDKMKE